MAQIFPSWANKVPLLLVVGLFGIVGPTATFGIWYFFSPEFTDVGYQPTQPIPYSHALHAGELAIDCRYCHSQVEHAAVASLPPSQVCMNCHQLVQRDSPKLAALHESMARGEGLRWVRIHNVPDYAYFDHSVHLRAGVGCGSCHGDIMGMEVVHQVETLSMAWCLDCHRDPAPHLRPADRLFDTTWTPGPDQPQMAAARLEELALQPPEDCTACHR